MNLQQYRQISPAMNEELKALFDKYGFDTRALRASIDDRIGIVRLLIEIGDRNHKSADGSVISPDAAYYLEHVRLSGELSKLKPEWLNDTFSMAGRTYTLTGMKRKGKKNLLIRRDDGKDFIMDEQSIAAHFSFKERSKLKTLGATENVGSMVDAGRNAKPLGELLR